MKKATTTIFFNEKIIKNKENRKMNGKKGKSCEGGNAKKRSIKYEC